MSVSYKVIGRHIQEARKQAKLTQRAVAEKLNMSDTYYGKIERGECRVNLERLAQISVLLHTPLEDLISGCMEQSGPADMETRRNSVLLLSFQKSHMAARKGAASSCCAYAETLHRWTENKIYLNHAGPFTGTGFLLFPVVRSTVEKQSYSAKSGGAYTDREQDPYKYQTITIYPLLQILRRTISPTRNFPTEQKSSVGIRFVQQTNRMNTEGKHEIQKQRSK